MRNKRIKKALLVTGIILLALTALAGASFIPTLWLKEPGMSELRGYWVNVYFEKEEAAAREVFTLAEGRAEQLAKKLGFDQKQDINIYIYDSQFVFQTKKYGLLAPMLGLDWYIGDNKGTNVLLTSPANPGKAHSYADCRDAVLHEMAHACNYVINSDMPLWLNEGAALYLSNGDPSENLYNMMPVPSFEDIKTNNPVKFADIGGYDFAYTYVEYLDKTYGWDNVLGLLRTGSYAVLGAGERDVYEGWAEYLKNNYS